jgi:Spy/CpxP family protein refolding chaperone
VLKFKPLRLAALLLSAGAVFAHADHRTTMPLADSARAEKRIDKFVGEMEKDLALSKDQSTRIRAILRKDPVAPPRHDMEAGMHEFRDLAAQLRSGKVDTVALDRSFEMRLGEMRARHASMMSKFAAIHAVLTPEQRTKAADLLEKRMAKMERNRGPHRR